MKPACGNRFFLEKMFAKLRFSLLLVTTLFLMVSALSTLRSCHLYNRGVHALNEQSYLRGITSFERSGLYYAPLNPFPKKSLAALLKIKNEREMEISGFPLQAGRAIVRALNQTSPWGEGVKAGNMPPRSFPSQSFLIYALTHLSFWGWLALTSLLFFRGFDSYGTFSPMTGIPTLLMALFCLGGWLFLIRFF